MLTYNEDEARRWLALQLEEGDDAHVSAAIVWALDELARLRKIEAAAREVLAVEMPHECYHPDLRDALNGGA